MHDPDFDAALEFDRERLEEPDPEPEEEEPERWDGQE